MVAAYSNHVADTGNGLEHLLHFVTVESLLVNFGHRNLKDALDAMVKEHLGFIEL